MQTRFVQVLVATAGLVSTVLVLWLASLFEWSSETSVILSLLLVLGTILIELILAFGNLREGITRLYPALDYSVQEQQQVYGLVQDLSELTSRGGPSARIALASVERVRGVALAVNQKSDFEVDNMFMANMIALDSLRPGERFLGLSAINRPEHWDYDPDLIEYRRINYVRASSGVEIHRIFLLDNEEERKAMSDIMKDQASNGIKASYLMVEALPRASFFHDFSVFPEHDFALYVPKIEKLLTCVGTHNRSLVAKLEEQFRRLEQVSNPVLP